jgi:hypothetical protein
MAGMVNPAIVVKAGTHVSIQVINADNDAATASSSPPDPPGCR